jgi:hydrogenase nickel incorporation protein HypB
MCTVCGCGDMVMADGKIMSHDEAHHLGLPHSQSHAAPALPFPHIHAKGHDHHHYGTGAAGVSVPGISQERLIEVKTLILAKNDGLAASNRRVLGALGVLALNLVSSPGSGKTTLLCRTIIALGDAPLAVIEGDQQT